MDNHCKRYFIRGKKGIKNKDYDDSFVFIVAPQKYYDQDEEAKKYPNFVSYESCKEYLAAKSDILSGIWLQQIEQAIEKSKHSSLTNFNEERNKFFRRYNEYQESKFSNLYCASDSETSGTGGWVQSKVDLKIPILFIKHRLDQWI